MVIFIREHYPSRIYHRLSDQPIRTDVNPYEIVPFKYYILQKRSLFEKFDCSNKIVFIGDSLTDGCEWNELLERTDIVNRGINSDTTDGILNRLNGCLLQKPKGIFITVGTNDIYRGVSMATIQSNYAEIIKNISDLHIPLFVQSTLYINFLIGMWSMKKLPS